MCPTLRMTFQKAAERGLYLIIKYLEPEQLETQNYMGPSKKKEKTVTFCNTAIYLLALSLTVLGIQYCISFSINVVLSKNLLRW